VANNNKEEEVEDEEDSEVENGDEVLENVVKKQQPSEMITEKKPTGEITTDWTDYETIALKKKKKNNVV